MSRRADPRQLPLPLPSARVDMPRPMPAPESDPWAGIRLGALVDALLATKGVSARGLARELRCSPDTVVKIRQGRPPLPTLRARLVHLAWRGLPADTLAAAEFGPEPERNLRWHAYGPFADDHTFALEPAEPDPRALCGNDAVGRVRADWPTEPDSFAAIRPTCLRRWRDGRG